MCWTRIRWCNASHHIAVTGGFGKVMWRGEYVLCVSNDILNEYEEILEKLAGVAVAKYAIEAILNSPNTLFCVPSYHFNLIEADPDDNKFVDCAIATGATCIVTEDKHFSVLNRIDFPKVIILGIDIFLRTLE